ncbi:MAG: hypothetical protein ACJ75B_22245 [Flavisolibacter sp.]
MSLNNIQLKPRMLADLYGHSLLEIPSAKTSRTVFSPGENGKNILVIVSHDSVALIPELELNFLTAILSACKLTLDDILIVNARKTEQQMIQDLIDSGVKKILLFGIDPPSIGLPINFPAFQLQQFNQRTYVCAPSLPELEGDKTLKSKLWTCLKTLFGI